MPNVRKGLLLQAWDTGPQAIVPRWGDGAEQLPHSRRVGGQGDQLLTRGDLFGRFGNFHSGRSPPNQPTCQAVIVSTFEVRPN